MTDVFTYFAQDESGATAIEYGLIVALIAVAIITAAGQVGTDLGAIFTGVAAEVTAAMPN